jgi:acylphosphatase
MMSKIRIHIFIEGRVQGVFFRHSTLIKAQEIGIFGFVRNLPGGLVEAVFEGEEEKVNKITEWAKRGPSSAKVEKFNVNLEEHKGEFKDFEIR